MSSVATLYNVPSNSEDFSTWSFAHAAHHRDINRRIYEVTGLTLPDYILDPFDPRDPSVWEDQHQIMHQNFDAVLEIDGFDLSSVNFEDQGALAGWIFLNATEHYQAANILEIG